MVITILSVLFMLLGVILYLGAPPRWGELGKLLFFAGALAVAMHAGQKPVVLF